MISRFPSPSSWLLAAGTMIFGLTLGRYLVPSTPESRDGTEASVAGSWRGPDGPGGGTSEGRSTRSTRRKREPVSPVDLEGGRDLTAISDILNQGNRIERTRGMLALIQRLDQEGLKTAVEGFREKGWVDDNRGEFSLLLSAWMERSPFAALDYLQETEADGWTRKTAIAEWAGDDPSAAAAAIAGLEDEGEVNDWVVGLAKGVARNNPGEALFLIEELTSGETRQQALQEIVPEVVVRGVDFASQWIEDIQDPKLRNDAAKRLTGSLARRNPEAASEWVASMPDAEMQREASEIVSEIYAREDLEGAKDWVTRLPGEAAAPAAQNVVRHLARQDPAEAALWLRQLGNAPSLDAARIRFLQEAGRQDPVTALENIPTLSKARDQERYYREILSRWRKDDQDAAVAWAASHAELIPPRVLRSVLPRE